MLYEEKRPAATLVLTHIRFSTFSCWAQAGRIFMGSDGGILYVWLVGNDILERTTHFLLVHFTGKMPDKWQQHNVQCILGLRGWKKTKGFIIYKMGGCIFLQPEVLRWDSTSLGGAPGQQRALAPGATHRQARRLWKLSTPDPKNENMAWTFLRPCQKRKKTLDNRTYRG
jgi:hypothetical protein